MEQIGPITSSRKMIETGKKRLAQDQPASSGIATVSIQQPTDQRKANGDVAATAMVHDDQFGPMAQVRQQHLTIGNSRPDQPVQLFH